MNKLAALYLMTQEHPLEYLEEQEKIARNPTQQRIRYGNESGVKPTPPPINSNPQPKPFNSMQELRQGAIEDTAANQRLSQVQSQRNALVERVAAQRQAALPPPKPVMPDYYNWSAASEKARAATPATGPAIGPSNGGDVAKPLTGSQTVAKETGSATRGLVENAARGTNPGVSNTQRTSKEIYDNLRSNQDGMRRQLSSAVKSRVGAQGTEATLVRLADGSIGAGNPAQAVGTAPVPKTLPLDPASNPLAYKQRLSYEAEQAAASTAERAAASKGTTTAVNDAVKGTAGAAERAAAGEAGGLYSKLLGAIKARPGVAGGALAAGGAGLAGLAWLLRRGGGKAVATAANSAAPAAMSAAMKQKLLYGGAGAAGMGALGYGAYKATGGGQQPPQQPRY